MKKSRFSEEQTIGILKQHEAGVETAELCREHGAGAATSNACKSKYGGMGGAETQRLKGLEDENSRPKPPMTDLSLDKEALKSVIRKKRLSSFDSRIVGNSEVGSPASIS